LERAHVTPALSLEEAQARLLKLATPLSVERVDVPGALGRYLAEPLIARRTQPSGDLSAMDGYAVRAADIAGPWRVVGESAAGHPYSGKVHAGEAVRISTGAIMPHGADAMVLQEDVSRNDLDVTLTGTAPHPPGRHIRREGSDFLCDTELLPIGSRVGPAQVALAIACGHNHLAVRRIPRVAIIDSGDELAADPTDCGPHQIPASNGPMLSSLAASVPCQIQRIGPVADDGQALAQALNTAARADVIVTSGGASVGDHDLIRPALADWGAELDFWRVAIRPGKPLIVAKRGRQLVLGLPGNPVSSHVTAYFFLLPLLRTLLGASEPLPRSLTQRLSASVRAGGARREFVRARFTDSGVEPLSIQDSGALAALAAAEVLIDRPANSEALPAGTDVPVYLLENGGIA
jgi:molybdopterin molybdotransferase